MKSKLSTFVASCVVILLTTTTSYALNNTTPTDSDVRKVGDLVFIAGQGGGTVGVQDNDGAAIKEAFEAIRKIARENGGDLKDIVRLDVFLHDLPKDFEILNYVEAQYFPKPYPPRTVVGGVIPKNHTVEINAIMAVPHSGR